MEIRKDVWLASRVLANRLSFTVVVVCTLALGIGACAAVFAVVNSVLLRPLPFQFPERIALLPSLNRDAGGKLEEYGTSLSDFLDWRERNRSFTTLAAMQPTEVAVTGGSEPQQVDAGLITANLFSTLGVRPILGRYFYPQEEVENSHVVILSHGLWRRLFGESKETLSRTIIVDGIARQIVGVAPPEFFFAANAELWIPVNLAQPRNSRIGNRNVAVTGRLRDGVNFKQAAEEMKNIAGQLAREIPANAGWSATALPIREPYIREVRGILLLLMAAASFLLLIVCVNVANVVLVRNVERRGELVIRMAIGGSRAQILRQAFIENAILTTAGGIFALMLSNLALKPMIALSPLVASSPSGNRILNSVTLDFRVLLFVAILTIITSLILTLLPSFQLTKLNAFESLMSGARRTTGGLFQRKFQNAFVVAQLAISFLLLIGAGFMMKSFQQLKTIDPGFELRSLLTARISLPATRYETHEKRLAFEQQLLEKTKTVPGVISASTTTRLPLNEFAMTTIFEVDGVQTPEGGFVANFRRIGPGYFQTLKTTVLEGREFTDHDLPRSMPVIVISREMAKRFWPGQSAIGKRIRRLSPSDRNWRTIVGVVGDLKDSSVTTAPGLTFYVPFLQASISSFHLVIRTVADPAQIVSELRSKIQEIDKDIPLYQEATAEELFLDSLSRPRFGAYLLACFAVLGLVISLIGVYGIISYSTSQRTNEIGVRMAIGAERRSVLMLILQQSLKLTVWGILIGGLMAIVVERTLSSMWYGQTNFSIYFATTVVLTITALLSSLVPALRATRINPAAAIRYE